MKEFIIEMIKFFKNNLIKIVVGMLLIALPYIWWNSRTGGESADTIDGAETLTTDEEQTIIETEANPASFSFFVEHLDGYPFSNNAILASYITTPDILEGVEQETGINISDFIQSTQNQIYFQSEDGLQTTEMKVLGVSKSPNEHLNELYVNVGNEEDNLEIVNYFYEAVVNDEIPMLADKTVYIFQEPRILEIDTEDALEVSEEIAVKSAEPFGRTIVVGTALGLIVVIAVLLLIAFFSKKLYYLFTYAIRENDSFIVMDKKLGIFNEEIEFLLNGVSDAQNVLVTEAEGTISNTALNAQLKESVNSNTIRKVSNVFEIEDFTNVGRLIYIIEEGKTNRSWYNKQRRYDEFYHLPTVLIQINKNQQDNNGQ